MSEQHPAASVAPPSAPPASFTGAPAIPPATSFLQAAQQQTMPPPPPPLPVTDAPVTPADLGANFPVLVQPSAPAVALDAGAPLASAADEAHQHDAVVHASAAIVPEPARTAALAEDVGHAVSPAPAPGIFAPSIALIVAMFALTAQLVSAFAQHVLPLKIAAGEPLDQFEVLVSDLPLVGPSSNGLLAPVLAAGAVLLIGLGARRGIRDVPLQVAVIGICIVAFAGAWLFPALV